MSPHRADAWSRVLRAAERSAPIRVRVLGPTDDGSALRVDFEGIVGLLHEDIGSQPPPELDAWVVRADPDHAILELLPWRPASPPSR